MGTNYDVVTPPGPWGESQTLHVGKSSAGWKFLFQAHDEPRLTSVADWRAFLAAQVADGPCQLVDEYGKEIEVDQFWMFVQRKQDPANMADGTYTDAEGFAFEPREFS